MRIVFFVTNFPQLSETFIVNKFLGLLERGLDVHIVCEESDPDEVEDFPRLQSNKLALARVHESWPHRPKFLAALLTPFALLRCLILNPTGTIGYLMKGWQLFGIGIFRVFYLDSELIILKPDVVHFEFGAIAVGRTYIKELLACKIVVSFRGYDLNYAGVENPEYYSEVWEKADYLHLLGADLWNRAMDRGCPDWKPHSLIPPAIDTQFFNAPGREHTEVAGTIGRPLRILSVGRLDWRKGYDYSLEAVKILMQQNIHCRLQIVGGGQYMAGVAFARHQLGLEDVVEFLGPLSPEKVKARMLGADLLLHAAVSEGFCNAVIEAQSMCLPILCTDAGGLPENVSDGETGFIVRRRDPRALAEKLRIFAENPSLRQQMGQAGRRRTQELFSLNQQISAFESLYFNLSDTSALNTFYVAS